MEKTNVMRLLDAAKLSYVAHTYEAAQGAPSGTEVAAQLRQDPGRVLKTLATVASSGKHYVFVIPVDKELNLKKAASAVHEKKIEMLKSRELLPLTGYVHGGCSPIGMKKAFPTVLDETALKQETVVFSAGKIGFQVEVAPEDLRKIVPFTTAQVAD